MSKKTNTQQFLDGLADSPDVVKQAPKNAVPAGGMECLVGVLKRKRYRKNLEGMKFGRLTVVGYDSRSKNGSSRWMCNCDCGKAIITRSDSLRSGSTLSCGCISREKASERVRAFFTTHGLRHTPIYESWAAMKARCTNPRNPSYRNYGGRGIAVCSSWISSFEAFLSDMGPRTDGTSLDRIDVDGNYEPSNCRWASSKTQQRNRRNNRHISVNGETKTCAEWAEIKGLRLGTLWNRLDLGWSDADAVLTPILNQSEQARRKALTQNTW